MTARDKEENCLFTTAERRRSGQTYYLCQKEKATEAEEWLDNTFNRILIEYGAEICNEILGGKSHARREKNVRATPKISAYLRGVNISTQRDAEYRG